jgi:uncharacterized protein (TIGR02996 family)
VSDRAPLLQAIRDADNIDVVPRLVYADWLLENGDAERGLYIQLSCRYMKLDEKDPSRHAVLEEWRKVFERNKARWQKELAVVGILQPEYTLGSIEKLSLTAAELLKRGDAILAAEPVWGVWLKTLDAEALVRWPGLGMLRFLGTPRSDESDHGLELLLAAKQLRGLAMNGSISPAGLAALAATPLRPIHVDLRTHAEDAMASFLRSPAGERITTLHVTGERWGDEVLRALARPMRNLRVRFVQPTRESLEPLLGDELLSLSISEARIDAALLELILARSPKLDDLALSSCRLSPQAIAPLLAARPKLISLNLSDNPDLGADQTVRDLTQTFYGAEIDLRGCGVDDDLFYELRGRRGPVRTRWASEMPPGWYGKLD